MAKATGLWEVISARLEVVSFGALTYHLPSDSTPSMSWPRFPPGFSCE